MKKLAGVIGALFLLVSCGTSDSARVVKDQEDGLPKDGCIAIEMEVSGWDDDVQDYVRICGKGAEKVEDFFHRRDKPIPDYVDTTERPSKKGKEE